MNRLACENPTNDPNSSTAGIQVKRLLRTQGTSLMREKSENEKLYTATLVKYGMINVVGD
jgi:hypothetical protein